MTLGRAEFTFAVIRVGEGECCSESNVIIKNSECSSYKGRHF